MNYFFYLKASVESIGEHFCLKQKSAFKILCSTKKSLYIWPTTSVETTTTAELKRSAPICGTNFIRLYDYSIHLPLSIAADGVIAVTGDSSSDLSLLTIWSNFSSIFFILLAIFWLSTSKASILRTNLLTTLKIFDCPMSPKVENDYSNLMIFDILLKVIQVFYRQTLLYVWQCWKEMFWNLNTLKLFKNLISGTKDKSFIIWVSESFLSSMTTFRWIRGHIREM